MNRYVRTNEPDVSGEPQHTFATSSPMLTSLVKSVRTDFKDIPEYYAKQIGTDITRIDYTLTTFNEPMKMNVVTLYPVDCRILKIRLTDMPVATYSLNINGTNVMSSQGNEFNIAQRATERPNSPLSTYVELSRPYAVSRNIYAPEEPYIDSCAFTTCRIFGSKSSGLPDRVPIEITGYFDGSDTVETRKVTHYPHNRYDLMLNFPTDHLIVKYSKSISPPMTGFDWARIQLWIGDEQITIWPCANNGLLVIKLQDLKGKTSSKMFASLAIDHMEGAVNLSSIDTIFMLGLGYHVEQVTQAHYQVYTLPHRVTAENGSLRPHFYG